MTIRGLSSIRLSDLLQTPIGTWTSHMPFVSILSSQLKLEYRSVKSLVEFCSPVPLVGPCEDIVTCIVLMSHFLQLNLQIDHLGLGIRLRSTSLYTPSVPNC